MIKKTKRKKKAAIELSLGFIVLIVFSVVLLSLAIVWIRDIMSTMGGISEQLMAAAKSDLEKTFQENQRLTFSVSPKEIKSSPNGKGYAAVGIRNLDQQSRSLYFVVNFIPATTNVLSRYSDNGVACTEVEHCDSLQTAMKSWISWTHEPILIQPYTTPQMLDTFITLPGNAIPGMYSYFVVTCKADDTELVTLTYDTCTLTSTNKEGAAETFRLVISGGI